MSEATNTEFTAETSAATGVGEAVRTAVGHVPGGYEHKLEEAVTAATQAAEDALAEQKYDLYEKLYEAASSRGYGNEARGILEAAGLSERPAPEPEPVVESTPEVDDADKSDRDLLEELVGTVRGLATRVNDQGETVTKLVNAASSRGIHIG